jgi:hypothetical protein
MCDAGYPIWENRYYADDERMETQYQEQMRKLRFEKKLKQFRELYGVQEVFDSVMEIKTDRAEG